MEIRCVKGMYRLKLLSSENNSGIQGLNNVLVFTSLIITWGLEGSLISSIVGDRSSRWSLRRKRKSNGDGIIKTLAYC